MNIAVEDNGTEHEVNEPNMAYGGIYTYADYLKWTIQERFELIKGKVFRMSPAPNRVHQVVSGNIFFELKNFLLQGPCQVFSAPFDVRLPRRSKADNDIITVVQPDICVICDPSKLDDRGAIGAPELVVEILSPGNNTKELKKKYEVYEEAGVKEYWIISPQNQTCLVYTLAGNTFMPSRLMTTSDIVYSQVLPGFSLYLHDAFKDI